MPVYEFECRQSHRTEEHWDVDDRPATTLCGECGKKAKRIISQPVIQTLATHMAGVRGIDVAGDGSYVDHNLGPKPVVVRDLAHKNRLLKERGLYQTGDTQRSKAADARKKKRVTVNG